MSRRSAAKRFEIAASTAIKWVAQWRWSSHVRPRPHGGDQRSQRIEAYRDEILAFVDERPDTPLAELVAHLDETHGVQVVQSTGLAAARLARYGLQKKPRTPPNCASCRPTAPTSTPSR